jgi:mRNA interferase YafQ
MKYIVKFSTRFNKDLKRLQKQDKNLNELKKVVSILANGEKLPDKYNEHFLIGNYNGCLECHIKPDWLLIYRYVDNELILYLMRSGSHSDLF